MPEWEDDLHGVVWSYDTPMLEVDYSDPVTVAELYGPNGEVLIRLVDREPPGYRLR